MENKDETQMLGDLIDKLCAKVPDMSVGVTKTVKPAKYLVTFCRYGRLDMDDKGELVVERKALTITSEIDSLALSEADISSIVSNLRRQVAAHDKGHKNGK
mgnify:CR=1 FL=1